MKNRSRKLTTMLLVIIFTIAIAMGSVYARWNTSSIKTLESGPNIGKKLYIGDVHHVWGLFCAESQSPMLGSTYRVERYVKIEGNTATNDKGTKTTNKYNAVLAYILAGGSNSEYGFYERDTNWVQPARQMALWRYFNTWKNKSGKTLGLSWNCDNGSSYGGNKKGATKLINEANAYAKNVDSLKASIKNKGANPVVTSNALAGPFLVEYTGSISSIVVRDTSGQEIKKGITICDAKGNKTNIKSNTKFYIKNTSGKTLKRLTINVAAKDTLTAEIWSLRSLSYGEQRLLYVKQGKKPTTASVNIDIKTYGNLKIVKKDKKTGAAINGVGFKIKTSSGWLQKISSGYKYNQTFANATTFKTSGGKGVTLNNLNLATYHVYEVSAPTDYPLDIQPGYDTKNKWVDFGTAKIDGSKQDVEKTYTNVKEELKPISIKGYVFIDIPETKVDDTNNLYDNWDKRVQNVKVYLKNKSNNNIIAQTTTNANGEYTFDKKITQDKLSKCYVQFDYNGIKVTTKTARKAENADADEIKEISRDISNYIPIAFNSTKINEIRANGSRALAQSMPENDADFKGVATTYRASAKEATYGLSGNLFTKLYNSNNQTLENINLGIKPLKEPGYQITQNIAYARIEMRGYTYTYNYGGTGQTNMTAAPQVRWQSTNSIKAYSMPIYPSDATYEEKNANEDLKVYVGYRTDITNTTNYDLPELYQEQKMMVTSLVDKFDSDRYELNDKDNKHWKKASEEKTGKYEDGKEYHYQTTQITDEYLNEINKKGEGIAKNKTAISFIEFKVKRDALLQILDTVNNPYGIIEKYPTTIRSTAYHIYRRKDYSWQNDITKEQQHKTKDDIRFAEAPYMIFKLGEKRILSGKVFEDTAITTDGRKLGDGRYNNENVVEGVKVELLDVGGGVSKLYGLEYTDHMADAIATTNAEGNYTLSGIVPGEYLLRFTYADGSQKIRDLNNNEFNVEAKDYKSTIVNSDIIKDALINGDKVEAKKHLWYKNLDATNYSVAVDDIKTKIAAMSGTNTGIQAKSPIVSITVENENENNTAMNIFGGFNFGIIKVPEQKVITEKLITNISIINGDNQLIANGNPEDNNIRGVTDLDGNKNGGSSFARVELEDSLIHGSTIEIKYEIKVTNESDVDYKGEKYYWFGDNSGLEEITVRVDKVIDNLDPTILYIPEKSDGTIEQVEDHLEINDWGILYTNQNKSRTNNNTSKTVALSAKRVLTPNDDDMEIVNREHVAVATNTIGSNDGSDSDEWTKIIRPVALDEEKKATLTITPPTGNDKIAIALYIITGAITLALLSVGVIIIKKKVV